MAGWSYTDAGTPSDALQIKNITVTPDPPTSGKQAVFTIEATAQDAIADGAYLRVIVKLGLIKLLQKQVDLLAELRGEGSLNLACDTSDGTSPIPKGDTTLTLTMNLAQAPQAKFSVAVEGFAVDDSDLVSLKADIDLRR